ncbi:MAG: glycine cleavage system protein GcvH [Phycisphaeraceae bacterium]
MASPKDRRYLESHEWHKLEGDIVVIGVSQFAVDELTDITYVDFRKKAGPIKAGEAFGEIESVKATSDLYCGIDGTIVAVNDKVADDPSLVNRDPFGDAWLIKIKPDNAAQLDGLLAADDYDAKAGGH